MGNGLAFIHFLSDDISHPTETDEADENMPFQVSLKIEDGLSNELKRELCPVNIIEAIRTVQTSAIKPREFSHGRFMPQIYVMIKLKDNLRIHFMVKKHLSGIIERLTAIESRGFRIFESRLGSEVAKLASSIVHENVPIFKEIDKNKKLKY